MLASPSRPTTRQRRFYVSYTDPNATCGWSSTGRRRDSELLADPASARSVLAIPEPTPKHHGGMLAFGPDGYLYIGSGDGGPPAIPTTSPRTAPCCSGRSSGSIPPARRAGKSRPALPDPQRQPVRRPAGRDEIYAYGLRNPWRLQLRPLHRRRSRSATSATTASRRSTTSRPARRAAPTSAGRPTRASCVLKGGRAAEPRTVLPVFAYPPRPGLRGHRRLHRPRPPPRAALRPRAGRPATSSATTAPGSLFAFRPRPDQAGKRPKAPLSDPVLDLVRRGQLRPDLRASPSAARSGAWS